jgi:hypothetical protein
VRGVILDRNGNLELNFYLGLGIAINNEAKSLVAYRGPVKLWARGVRLVIVIGDSSIVLCHLHF